MPPYWCIVSVYPCHRTLHRDTFREFHSQAGQWMTRPSQKPPLTIGTLDGTPVTVQSPCFTTGSFMHLHWLGSFMVTTTLQQSWSFRWQGNPLSSENQRTLPGQTKLCADGTQGVFQSVLQACGPRAWQGLGTFMMTSEILHWCQSVINPC